MHVEVLEQKDSLGNDKRGDELVTNKDRVMVTVHGTSSMPG